MTAKINGENGLTIDEVVQAVQSHRSELGERFGVTKLSVLTWLDLNHEVASPAIDFWVEFDGAPTASAFFGASEYLGELIGYPVYLTTENGLQDCRHRYAKGQTIVV